jgi:hypothetical protein
MNRPVTECNANRARLRAVVAASLALLAGVGPLAAAATSPPEDAGRNYLTVQGRVLDRRGNPLVGTWIFCTGSRRAGALVDSTGAYLLEIPGATLEELETAPLRIRVQARLKGWRFATQNGAAELGLEMRLAKQESGLSRLRVRSNDAEAVAAVAGSIVLEANPRALIATDFIGTQGAQYETPPALLTASEEVTVAGDAFTLPAPGPSPPEADPPARTTGPPAGIPVAAVSPAPASPPVRRDSVLSLLPASSGVPPAPVTEPVTPAASASTDSAENAADVPGVAPSSALAPGATSVSRAAKDMGGPPAAATPPPRDSRSPTARATARKDAGSGAALRGSKAVRAVVYRPALDRDGGRSGREARDAKTVVVNPAEPPPPLSPVATPSASPAPGIAAAPSKEADGSGAPASPPAQGPGPAAGANPAAVAPPAGTAAPGSTRPGTPYDDPTLRPVLVRAAAASSVNPRPPEPARPVTPAPRDSEPAAPVGIARTLPPPRAGHDATRLCDCTLRGTVEVQSDRPLQSRTEVVVSIAGSPVATTVELFMGSPRAFEIRPAPCGPLRFALFTRSKQRFVLVSAEPSPSCLEGGSEQVRFVLEPVARWGTSR